MYTIKTGLEGDRSAVKRDSEKFYTWKRDVPPETRWLIKAGQGGSKAGRRDIAVEFSTVPPKAGRLTRMITTFSPEPAIAAPIMPLA